MKKSLPLFLLLCFLYSTASSQSCLPEGITFHNQNEIDSFQIIYPGCTEILGDVTITGNDIISLAGLNIIHYIDGFLEIDSTNSLMSLDGLDNLVSLGGHLLIHSNSYLFTLSGLDSLEHISGYLAIYGNQYLGTIGALSSVEEIGGYIQIGSSAEGANPVLTSLSGLENISLVFSYVYIENNESLVSLEGLENVSFIGGDLYIDDCSSLVNLNGLSGLTDLRGDLSLIYNESLVSLGGLEGLTSIEGDLYITNNPSLGSLAGIDNIYALSIDNLIIIDNAMLSTCHVESICKYFANPNGMVQVYGNAAGCKSQEEVDESCGNISVPQNQGYDFCSVYPNPANGIVDFRFQIKDFGKVTMKIFDIRGVEIASVSEVTKSNGEHTMSVDLSALTRGIYFYRLIANNCIAAGKIVLIR